MVDLYKRISSDWNKEMKEELEASQLGAGKLSGTSLALEDNISTKGVKTKAGSKMLEDYTPPFNASVVNKILLEGGNIKGKFQASEFGIAREKNLSMARLVSSGKVDASIGVDTCGEVRKIASSSGLYGFKPSYGAISRYGLISSIPSFETVGIVSSSIETVEILFQTISGKDIKDSTSIDIKKELNTGSIKIGVLEEDINGLKEKEKLAFQELIEKFERNTSIEYLSIPSVKYCESVFNIIGSGEFSSNMARFDGLVYGYKAKEYKGWEDYFKKNRTEGFSSKVKEKIMFGNFVLSHENYEKYYGKSQRIRRLIKEETSKALESFHIILRPINISDNSNTCLSNIVGCPSISLPISKKGVGVELITKNLEDLMLLYLAKEYKSILEEWRDSYE